MVTNRLSTDKNSWKKQQVDIVLEEYKYVFKYLVRVALHSQVNHYVDLVPSSSLPNAYVYISFGLENEEIYRQIENLIDKWHIQPNPSLCGSKVILVPKKDGAWRMFIDDRALN